MSTIRIQTADAIYTCETNDEAVALKMFAEEVHSYSSFDRLVRFSGRSIAQVKAELTISHLGATTLPRYLLRPSPMLDPRFTGPADEDRRGIVRNREIRVFGEVFRFDSDAPLDGTHVQVDQHARFADRRPGLHLVHNP